MYTYTVENLGIKFNKCTRIKHINMISHINFIIFKFIDDLYIILIINLIIK